MFPRILPVKSSFFECFDKHSNLAIEGAKLLEELLGDLASSGPRAKRIKEVEHEADVVTHQAVEMLHTTFVTPFDRNEIHRLVSSIDDIVDAVEAAAERLWLYDITAVTPEAVGLAKSLVHATTELHTAIQGLRHVKKERDRIVAACVEVNRIENESDNLLRQGLAKLFREEKDPIAILKWKEIYEILEQATDRCEDAANVIDGVVLENA